MDEHKSSILVVDDDDATCRNFYDILTDLGYLVDTAVDGLTALDLVQKSSYDVALLDQRMPGMDGLTLCRRIRELRPEAVPIMITAHVSGDFTNKAVAAGVWKILAKPVDSRRLLDLIEQAWTGRWSWRPGLDGA